MIIQRFITKTVITKFMDLGEKVFKPNIIFKVKEGINFKKKILIMIY